MERRLHGLLSQDTDKTDFLLCCLVFHADLDRLEQIYF